MPSVSVRYIVRDIEAAIVFYWLGTLASGEDTDPNPSFATCVPGRPAPRVGAGQAEDLAVATRCQTGGCPSPEAGTAS